MLTKPMIILVLLFLLFFNGNTNWKADNWNTINSIIGNISYQHKFGEEPSFVTDEVLRIQTHLEYVENILRSKSTSELNAKERSQRLHMLDLLHAYWTAGIFPRNYDYPEETKPCFIDRDGTICAVGYLVTQTEGSDLAQEINDNHQYSEILDIDSPDLLAWINQSGLSIKEMAMIQPRYQIAGGYSYISPAYGSASSILGGANLAISAMNISQLSRFDRSRELQIVGLATGAASTTLGLATLLDDSYWNGSNKGRKNLSMINIAIGTAGMCIAGYSLLTNKKKTHSMASWSLYCYPENEEHVQVGFNFARSF